MIYLFPYQISLALSLGIAYYAYRFRHVTGAKGFALCSFAQAGWTFFYILELTSTQLNQKLFWDEIQWAFAFLAGIGIWIFARAYTAEENIKTEPELAWLLVFPVSFLIFVLPDRFHSVVYDNIWLEQAYPFDALFYDFTPLLLAATFYTYVLILVSLYLLIQKWRHAEAIYARQLLIIIAGGVIIVAGTAITLLLEITIFGQRDHAPFIFVAGNLVIAWGLFRYQIFDLTPIAHRMITDNIQDGIVVLDTRGRVVNLNPKARAFADPTLKNVIGLPAEEVFPDWKPEIARYRSNQSLQTEIYIEKNGDRRYYELNLWPIKDRRDQTIGLISLTHDITHLKRAEIALRESEARYRLLAENITDSVTLHTPDGQFIYASPSYLRTTGYTFEELQQISLELLVHPDDLPRTRNEAHRQVLAGKIVTKLEYRRRKQSGEYIWVEADTTPIQDEQGNVIQLLNTSRDITERKQAEQAKEFAEYRAHRYLNASAVMMLVLNEQGEITFINHRGCELLGFQQQELIGKNWFDFCISENQAETIKAAFYGLTSDDAQSYIYHENLVRTKSGEERLFAFHNTILFLEGYVVELLSSGEDITDRRRAENALRDSQRFIEQMTRAIPDIAYIFDFNQLRTVYTNRLLAAELGYSPEYLQAMGSDTMAAIMPPEDYTRLFQAISRLRSAQDHEVLEFEFRYRHKNGEYRWRADRTVIYLRNPDGTPHQFLGISRDITEQKIAEEQQAQLMVELENANTDLKDFAYIVSHDLKAPLRGIGSLAGWLTMDYADRLDDAGREMLDLLTGRVKRMEALINGVLEYSRIGRVPEATTPVDLNTLVAGVIDSVIPAQNFEVTVENNLPIVTGEPARLTQIFQNLLSNAVKFMDKPHGKIRIGCQYHGDFWQFYVADNGPGIEERFFSRIFQIFQTLTSRDERESTGVGLTIARRIVELYGGRIWVESDGKEGSIFYFTLPWKDVKA